MMNGQNIGYIRVSTAEQNTNRQLEGITLHKVFIDKCSGKDTKRPQLQALLEFIREGDTLYVHSMDRLARNLDDLRKLVTSLNKNNIKIHFLKDNLIFSGEDSPMAKFTLSIMGAFAEFERELINERIREGVAIAKASGKYKGRTKTCNQEQIADIKDMAANRYKITEIAKKYGVTRTTIYRYLDNKTGVIA